MANVITAKDFEQIEGEVELPFTLTLREPIEWGSETRETIVITKRLKAKHFKGMRGSDMSFTDQISLISQATVEPFALIEEIDAGDFMVLSNVINSFLPPGLTTGDNR